MFYENDCKQEAANMLESKKNVSQLHFAFDAGE